MLSGWEFFNIHHALKLHFTSESYDVLKYNGRSNMKYETYQNRRDRLRFDSFAHKLIGKTKAGHFCIANFVHGSHNFVYEQYNDAYDIYLQWKKVRESMSREFEKDVHYLNQLASSRASFDLFAKTKNGHLPPILQVTLGQKINIETLIILNKEHKEFFDTWTEFVHNDPMLSKTMLVWKKYQPFVLYDADKINKTLEGAMF